MSPPLLPVMELNLDCWELILLCEFCDWRFCPPPRPDEEECDFLSPPLLADLEALEVPEFELFCLASPAAVAESLFACLRRCSGGACLGGPMDDCRSIVIGVVQDVSPVSELW